VNWVTLSDEERLVILTEEARRGLAQLDAHHQEIVVKCLLNIVTADVVPSELVYEQILNLDILRPEDQCRLYSRVVENLPRSNTMYHLVFVLYIDAFHEYRDQDLAEYSSEAERKANEVVEISTVGDLETYLEEHNALNEDDIRELLP
jgi:hypothetical protein